MSFAATKWAWEQTLPLAQKAVLLALADHANDQGVCWPKQERIASLVGCTTRTVRVALKELVAAELVITDTIKGLNTTYRVNMAVAVDPVVTDPQRNILPVSNGLNGGKHRKQVPVSAAPTPEDIAGPHRKNSPVSEGGTPEASSGLHRKNLPPNLLSKPTKEEEDTPSAAGKAEPEPQTALALVVAEAEPVPGNVVAFPAAEREPPRVEPVVPSAKAMLYGDGLQSLMHMTGKPAADCRRLLGVVLRIVKDDAAVAYDIIVRAVERRPADPTAWIMGAAHHRAPKQVQQADVARAMGRRSFADRAYRNTTEGQL